MYVKVPPFPPPGPSIPETAEGLVFWSAILSGNSATCTTTSATFDYGFCWNGVEKVKLGKTECTWNDLGNEKIQMIMGTPSFSIDNELKDVTGHLSDNFASRALQILRIIPNICNDTVISQRTRAGAVEQSDSSDETEIDEPIPPPFSEQEWKLIQCQFTQLRKHYRQAKARNFENAVGKYFLTKLLKFCCVVVENREDQESLSETMCMGTNPSGDAQPGSSQFIKEIPGRRGRSATSSVTSSPAPGTSTETSTEQLEWSTTRKYSDVCHWDHVRKLYPICGEAKSGDKQPAENQLIDQMFGLFRPDQKVMLGFAVKPNQACIKIMEKEGMHTLNCRSFPNLNLTIMKDMQVLVRLFFGFIFFVDCGSVGDQDPSL